MKNAGPKAAWRSLPEQHLQELAAMVGEGWTLLGLGKAPKPRDVAEAVERWLDDVQDGKHRVKPEISGPVALAWGDALARQMHWEWGDYVRQGGAEVALAPPDRACVHLPLAYIFEKLERGATVNAMLLFNMLAAGQRPPSQPGDMSVIG